MKILVTGAAGYLGSILVPLLLRKEHRVTVIDNFCYSQISLLDSCHYPNLRIVRGDVRDEELMAAEIKKADAVIPLACITGAPACDRDPIAARSVNLDAIRTLLRLRARSQFVLFPTTNSGYGIGQRGIYCTEDSPLKPVSLYARLKVEAEKAILDAGNSLTFRLATAFGISPRMRLDLLVNDFTYRAVTDRFVVLFQAHFKRNYVHVRDIAGAFLHGLENFDRMKDQPYNFGLSNANLSKSELCREIQKAVPAFCFMEAAVGEDPDKRNYVVSNKKIERTGLKAAISLREGIAELIKGYQVIRRTQFTNL